MKETKKCSLSGLAFTMEEDAYRTLKEYLDSLKAAYKNDPDGGEIIADIEARIVELILSAQDGEKVIECPLIQNIIAQLGSAEDISEESTPDEPTRTPQGEPRIPRRLYRDMEGASLGGVCAGLAKYFSVDVAWVRVGCFSPLLLCVMSWIPFMGWLDKMGINLFGCVILGYLVMWIAVPAARTARQKLEASGEKITVQSIRDASSGSSSDPDRVAKPVVAETVTVIGRILIFILKMFAAMVVFGLILFALLLFGGIGVLIFASVELFGEMGYAGDILMTVDHGTLIAIVAVCIVLVPVIILLYVLTSLLLGVRPNRWALLIMFLVWICTIISLPVLAIKDNLPNLHADNASHTYVNAGNQSEHERLLDSIERAAESYVLPEPEEGDTVNVRLNLEPIKTEGLKSIDKD